MLRRQGDSDLTPSMGAVLATIARHGPLTPAEVADREGFRRPTASRVVAKLEGLGLVTRVSNPADGRSFVIAVAPAGAALLTAARSRKTAYLEARLADLPAEDVAVLDRAAAILERLLEDER